MTLDELRQLLREGINARKILSIREGSDPFEGAESDLDWLDDLTEADLESSAGKLDMAKMASGRMAAAFAKVSTDGKDAMLVAGKHKGKLLSDVARDDPGYISWILREPGISEAVKDVCRYALKAAVKRRMRS